MGERFSPYEEQFFRPEIKEAAPEREERHLDVYQGSCAPSWLTFPRAVAFLTFVTLGGGNRLIEARTEAEAQARSAEIAQAQAEQEHREAERFSQELQRVEDAFKGGAQTVREQPAFAKEFSKEVLEVFAQEFETFPARRLFELVADASGRSLYQVAADNKLQVVEMYSDTNVSAFISRFESETGVNQDDKAAAQFALERAGINVAARAILLNASVIAAHAKTPEELRRRVQDVLVHEFLHSFDGTHIGLGREKAFYEGLTEALSNRLGAELYPDRGTTDPFAGYIDGSTVSAELVVAATPDQASIWKGYLDANLPLLGRAFDDAHTPGAFQRALSFDKDHTVSPSYDALAPVLGLVQELGDQAPSVIDAVNARLDTGRLFTAEVPGASSAVFLVGDQAVSGILNSAVRFEEGGQVKIARFLSSEAHAQKKGATTVSEVHVYDPLWRAGDASLDRLPKEEVQQRLSDLLEKEAGRLELLAN